MTESNCTPSGTQNVTRYSGTPSMGYTGVGYPMPVETTHMRRELTDNTWKDKWPRPVRVGGRSYRVAYSAPRTTSSLHQAAVRPVRTALRALSSGWTNWIRPSRRPRLMHWMK